MKEAGVRVKADEEARQVIPVVIPLEYGAAGANFPRLTFSIDRQGF
jgi:hypothetical protein